MSSIHNMIHADIESAEVGNAGCVNIHLSGNHTLTIFPDTQGKSHAEIARAINDAINDASNTEQS